MVNQEVEGTSMGESSAAVRDVIAERRRQVENEGWSEAHDDRHNTGDLAAAAGCYALFADSYPGAGSPPPQWPWTPEWWKPKEYRRDLVRATALLLAEIERVDRCSENAKAMSSQASSSPRRTTWITYAPIF